MKYKTFGIAITLLTLLVAQSAMADEAASMTVVVKKMHCKGCAQRIARKIYEVAGVKEVRVNVEKKTLLVATTQAVSPRAIWEAVEKGKDTPVRIEGPQGSFTKKPSS